MKGDANMIGLDTGFFVELLKANKEAVELWKKIMDGEDVSVSCLSIFELKRLSLKRAIDSEAVETLIEAVLAICKVVWLDNNELLLSGASLSYGPGIASTDALILASLVESGAQTIFTIDHHLEGFKKKGVKTFIIGR
jgi:predicted nucleic acid-binding protein